MQATLLAEIEKRDHQASQEKQLLETEVSELRMRLQRSEKRAEAVATQCKAVVLELRKTQAQRDNLRAHNQELRKQMEEDVQGTASPLPPTAPSCLTSGDLRSHAEEKGTALKWQRGKNEQQEIYPSECQ